MSWAADKDKWCAYIMIDRKKRHLGYFYSFEDAVSARRAAELEYGFCGLHGRDPLAEEKMSKPDLEGKPRIGASRKQSGIVGITWGETVGKWQTRFTNRGRNQFVGHFHTVEAALKALNAAKKRAGLID